jgi:hypothetical protein
MSEHDSDRGLTGDQDADIAAARAALARLTDPASATPAQAMWAVSQILGTARVNLRPHAHAFTDAQGDPGGFWIPGELFQTELALNESAEAAAGRTTPRPPEQPGDPRPRYMGSSAVARHFGVRQPTITNWLARYPHTHPALPTPKPDALYTASDRLRPLWFAEVWEHWDAWKAAKDAASADWVERFTVKPGESEPTPDEAA